MTSPTTDAEVEMALDEGVDLMREPIQALAALCGLGSASAAFGWGEPSYNRTFKRPELSYVDTPKAPTKRQMRRLRGKRRADVAATLGGE